MLLGSLLGMLSDSSRDIQWTMSRVIKVRHLALGIPKQCA